MEAVGRDYLIDFDDRFSLQFEIEQFNCQLMNLILHSCQREEENETRRTPIVKLVSSVPILPMEKSRGLLGSPLNLHCSRSAPNVKLLRSLDGKQHIEVNKDIGQHIMHILTDSRSLSQASYNEIMSWGDDSTEEEVEVVPDARVEEVPKAINVTSNNGASTISAGELCRRPSSSGKQPGFTSSILTTLEDVIKQLKENHSTCVSLDGLQGKGECPVPGHRNLAESLEQKASTIDDLKTRLEAKEEIIELRNRMIDSLSRKVKMAEEALKQVREEQLNMKENLRKWYNGLDEALQKKDEVLEELDAEVETLRDRLKRAESSAADWQRKYLNIEAHNMLLKTNPTTGRKARVDTPIDTPIDPDLLPGRPGARKSKRAPHSRDPRATKNSSYNPAWKAPCLNDQTSTTRKRTNSGSSDGGSSSGSPYKPGKSRSSEPLPRSRTQGRFAVQQRHQSLKHKMLRESVRMAYSGASETPPQTERKLSMKTRRRSPLHAPKASPPRK